MSQGLSVLVEKLRQEQEFVSFYKQQIRQSVQDLNSSCDQVFHSLWLSHTLAYGLHRVLAHNSHTHEWSRALASADSVKFINASKAVKSHLFVDRYSRFLTRLLNNPELLSEVLNLVETEGLDCAWVVNDLMSVVYGHCMFKRDHTLFLKLMQELLKQHIERCDTPKDLFGGVESVFNHVLSEYCSQLVELRTFLTMVLHDPLMQVLSCEEYLEFDVTKAGSRFQLSSEQNGLVGSDAFLFNEDLDVSCEKLAKLASHFLQNLVSTSSQFPIGLRWLLGSLKTMVRQKWPHISATDLRRPVSDAIFSSILSAAIVNPDSYGVVDPTMIISEVGRYNLTQIISVLQGCVWIMGKTPNTKYPIHKVVRRMDANLFFSLVDCIDNGLSGSIPDLPSFLPGVNRSAFLASQEQLDNLVGLVAMLVSNREGKGKFHSNISNLLSCLLPAMIEQASHGPYPITTKSSIFHSPPPTADLEVREKKQSLKKRGKKMSAGGSLEMLDTGGSLMHHTHVPQWGRGNTPDGKSKAVGEKRLKRSRSTDGCFSLFPAGFRLPDQVMIFQVLEKLEEGVAQWDFYLLTEEEFMGQKSPAPSPGPKSDEQSYFNSFLRSKPVPCTLDFDTPPMITAGLRSDGETEKQVTSIVKSNLAARGRVRSMIQAIEQERTRANTLPTTSTTTTTTTQCAGSPHTVQSVGGTPVHKSPLLDRKAGSERSPSEGKVQSLSDRPVSSPLEALTNSTSERTQGAGYRLHPLDLASRPLTATLPMGPTVVGVAPGVSVAPGVGVAPGMGVAPGGLTTRQHKLSTTFEVSLEESASYVKLRPTTVENGNSEEGEGQGEGRRKESRTEVFISLSHNEAGDSGSGCGMPVPSQDLEFNSDRNMMSMSSSPPVYDTSEELAEREELEKAGLDDTSDELDRPAEVKEEEEEAGLGRVHDNGSLQNLYLEEEGESPHTAGPKDKKKKRWKHIFKKRKSSEEHDTPKARRSQSDAPSEIERVERREDMMRSVSHPNAIMRGRGRSLRNRYTVYMEDYSAKLKKLSPKREEGLSTSQQSGCGLDDVDRGSTEDMLERGGDATPPAEMTPLTFKQSLFCNQLKYKLRSALQNIHFPLTLSPAFHQLQLENGMKLDIRYQLILLIQHALQHSQWNQNDMETALLMEILRMVEPLPSDLIQVTIDGVLENYHRRSAYIAYLVCSQQKFHDAKMQVTTVQNSIKRIMYIDTELFVNFAVRMFMETPGHTSRSQLAIFSKQMERLFLADEKCSLMTQRLSDFRVSLEEDTNTWECWEDKERVWSCLSDYLFTYINQHVFYPNGSTDKEVDKIFADHLTTLSKTITVTHRSLQIPFVYHSGCPWVAAQDQLRVMAAYKSPRGKLRCIVQSLRILISLLQYARCGDPPGADDLFPVLVYVLIKANPPAMLSTCLYIRNYAESSLQGEDAYWWAQFSTAVEFTKTLS